MSEKDKGIRRYVPSKTDFFAASGGADVDLSGQINESTVANFCRGCDKLGPDGVCTGPTIGSVNQARYVARKWCGWASVNDIRGQMTEEGFKPNK